VDEEVLEKLAEDHPLARTILDHRSLSKLKSTYTDKLPKMIHPKSGRIHTNYAQAVAVTGRLSSNEPNLQNIPVRTDLGAEIRKMFVPKEGHVLVDADYSQIELRVLAHIADDKTMQAAFCGGVDIHVTDPRALRAVGLGLHLVRTLQALYPGEFAFRAPATPDGRWHIDLSTGNDTLRTTQKSAAEIYAAWQTDAESFQEETLLYRLY
jgi:hypothetical protein